MELREFSPTKKSRWDDRVSALPRLLVLADLRSSERE